MEIRTLFTLAAFLIKQTWVLRVQVFPTSPQYTENPGNTTNSDGAEDVFSRILKTNEENMDVEYQGDIILGSVRSAIMCQQCIWGKRGVKVIIPYTMSSNYTVGDRAGIFRAMQDFETLTCIHFAHRKGEVNFIAIEPVDGCRSSIGMVGGRQVLSLLTPDCMSKGIIQHELCHSLGFHHEQARSDRDEYITVITENIKPGDLHHFDVADTRNMGFKYDFESVMHYSADAFTNRPGKPTIIPKSQTSAHIGQRYGLSHLDVQKINRLYECNVCATLLSKSYGKLSSHNYTPNYEGNVNCVWLIRTPSQQIKSLNNPFTMFVITRHFRRCCFEEDAQRKVFLKFEKLDIRFSPGCKSAHVNVYDGASRTSPVLLERSCGTEVPPPLMASSHMMLVELISAGRLKRTGFEASYRTVKCGNAFHKSPGAFTSPGYPGRYKPLLDCLWFINAPKEHTVYLRINHLELEKAPYCMNDYLSVFDGDDASSTLLGKYCGIRENIDRTSTGPSMLILLHTDRDKNLKGFDASFTFTPSEKIRT